MEKSKQVRASLLFLSMIFHVSSLSLSYSPGQEAQKIFKAKYPMEGDNLQTKLSGFGFTLLENVDPNPENFVSAAIFHSRQMQVGCLLRLEPNKQANVSCMQLSPTGPSRSLIAFAFFSVVDVPIDDSLEPRCHFCPLMRSSAGSILRP